MKVIRLRKRPGFDTFGMRIVYWVLYLFFHCRLVFSPGYPEDDEPVVFVANHYNAFGPISFILSVPLLSSVWVNEDIISPETAAKTFYPGIKSIVPFLWEGAIRWICKKLGQLACDLLYRFKAIPVDRDHPARLISTMRQSVAALEEGQNLIIFPETGLPEYSLTSVTPFFSGFATVGSVYYRKTKKPLRFCPCFIDEQHHTIRFGEIVTYQPEGTVIAEESARVSDELNLRIREMAAASRQSPREKSTPVRRTILFFCNLLRMTLIVPLIILLSLNNLHVSAILYAVSQGLSVLFNATVSRSYAASNHLPFLLSHALSLVTDACVLIHLFTVRRCPGLLLIAFVAASLIHFASNSVSLILMHWCAGINYFDLLSVNLICFLCFQQMMEIRLPGFFSGALLLLTCVFLALSAGYTVIYNLRYREEPETG